MTDISRKSLNQWLAKLESLHPTEIELGLDRVSVVYKRLLSHQLAGKVITVAGTNGKGSTVKLIEAFLLAEGWAVGAYTSPHFLHYNERVVVNGQPVSEGSLVEAFEQIEVVRGNISLTYFEFGTLAAFYLFAKNNLDVVILEVGLGGRLDAVNVAEPDYSVVTSIALDHEDWLGADLEQIGLEKAGIFRPNRPAVCGADVPASVIDHANEIGASLYQYGSDFIDGLSPASWSWRGGVKGDHSTELVSLQYARLPQNSVNLALQCCSLLGLKLTTESVNSVIADCKLPGRTQVLSSKPLLVADVAHNPQAASYLATCLKNKSLPGGISFTGKVIAVVGMLTDKDNKGVFQCLADVIDSWCLAGLSVPRGQTALSLSAHLEREDIDYQCSDSVADALHQAKLLAEPEDCVLVFGSFYTVAALYEALGFQQLEESLRG